MSQFTTTQPQRTVWHATDGESLVLDALHKSGLDDRAWLADHEELAAVKLLHCELAAAEGLLERDGVLHNQVVTAPEEAIVFQLRATSTHVRMHALIC
eukprot:SAG11_NODE_13689_length_643_cov_1.518382_2_plen_98_part_00